jgi:cation diffusion facilitator family transporter
MNGERSLTKYAWLSIAAAIATIVLKYGAYFVTGSVGMLSDAVESLVNLAAAIMALTMLKIAARPADADHHFGHDKAEYFSSGVEGTLIIIASIAIGYTSVVRFIRPIPLRDIEVGLAIAVVASAINFVVSRVLAAAAKTHNSITLEADAHHLMTDVWTSVGVIGAVAAVRFTGWIRLDPIIAALVALNILRIGIRLVRESVLGLMDTSLPAEDLEVVNEVLERYRKNERIEFHAILTRGAASRRFVSFHVLVPGNWTVQRGHDLLERIEGELRSRLSRLTVFTHLEPIEDPVSWQDIPIDRP